MHQPIICTGIELCTSLEMCTCTEYCTLPKQPAALALQPAALPTALLQVREVLEGVERTLGELQLGAGPPARSAAAALLAAAFKGMPVETAQAIVAAAAVAE